MRGIVILFMLITIAFASTHQNLESQPQKSFDFTRIIVVLSLIALDCSLPLLGLLALSLVTEPQNAMLLFLSMMSISVSASSIVLFILYPYLVEQGIIRPIALNVSITRPLPTNITSIAHSQRFTNKTSPTLSCMTGIGLSMLAVGSLLWFNFIATTGLPSGLSLLTAMIGISLGLILVVISLLKLLGKI